MMNYNKDFERFAISSGISSNTLNGYKNYINPTIIEERQMNMQTWDVFSRLMAERIIYLGEGINSDVANIITAQLLYLDSVSNDDITIFVNTPGGSVYDGMAIVDTMNYIKCPVTTVCVGLAASMGAVLLAAGEKGKRYDTIKTEQQCISILERDGESPSFHNYLPYSLHKPTKSFLRCAQSA